LNQPDIQVGEHYTAKVSGRVVVVRIKREHAMGGWVAYNLRTGNDVRVKAAARLLCHTTKLTAKAYEYESNQSREFRVGDKCLVLDNGQWVKDTIVLKDNGVNEDVKIYSTKNVHRNMSTRLCYMSWHCACDLRHI